MLYASAGNAAYALGQFGVLLAITRAATLETVGQYALALAICAPIHLGLGFRLRTARSVDAARAASMKHYWILAAFGAAVALTLSSGLAFFVFEEAGARLIMVGVAATKAVETFIDVHYGELQRTGDLRRLSRAQLVRAIVAVVTVAAVLALTDSVTWAVFAAAAASLLQFVLVERPGKYALRSQDVAQHNQHVSPFKLFRHVAPLGITAAVTSLNAAAPRIIVGAVLGESALGVYAVLTYSTVAMNLVANSIGQALIGQMSRDVAAKHFRRMLRSAFVASLVVMLGGILILLVLAVAGQTILGGLFGQAFADEVGLAILLAIGATLGGLATVWYYALSSIGNFKLHPYISLGVAAVALPTIYLLSSSYGLHGAAAGLIVGYSVQWIVTVAATGVRLKRAAK